MILLDTDHLTLLKYPTNPRYQTLTTRMNASVDRVIGTTIVSVEEQWRGWFSYIARHRDVRRQVKAYLDLVELHTFLSGWTVISFDDAAADQFEQLRAGGVRIGSMDLKIASIALVAWRTSVVGEHARFPKGCGPARGELVELISTAFHPADVIGEIQEA